MNDESDSVTSSSSGDGMVVRNTLNPISSRIPTCETHLLIAVSNIVLPLVSSLLYLNVSAYHRYSRLREVLRKVCIGFREIAVTRKPWIDYSLGLVSAPISAVGAYSDSVGVPIPFLVGNTGILSSYIPVV